MRPPLVVVGASARSAAMSAARAGFEVHAVDLFADRDLSQIATVQRCPAADYPHGIPDLITALAPVPVLYTGGLENHAEVLARLAARHPLWGNPAEVVGRVRDPFLVHRLLHESGFAVPDLRHHPAPGTGWLRKSFRSAGGSGVRRYPPGESLSPTEYLQEFIPGPSFSALYVSEELIGVTEQLIGMEAVHARDFHYSGSIGPVGVADVVNEQLVRLGKLLATGFGLRGVWGLDFILHDSHPWPVEINPRYTASVEVLERCLGVSVIARHAAAFGHPSPAHLEPADEPMLGKAIYFAPIRVEFPDNGPWDIDLASPWHNRRFADIPEPGFVSEAGQPVLTLFASGRSADECRAGLVARARQLDLLFNPQSGPNP